MQLVSSMTNEQLVRQIAAGSETAFNELYRATYRMVYLQAQKLLHDQDAAETVTQDVFVTVYRNIGKLENPEALRSWIGGIAVRLALKQRQKLASSRETDIESEQIMDILDGTAQEPTPESTLCEAENGRIIAELVDQLPEQQRATVFAGEPLLVGIERRVGVSDLLLQIRRIIVGGGAHAAVERVTGDVVFHKALGVRVAALIDEIRNADGAEKERDGKNRE